MQTMKIYTWMPKWESVQTDRNPVGTVSLVVCIQLLLEGQHLELDFQLHNGFFLLLNALDQVPIAKL